MGVYAAITLDASSPARCPGAREPDGARCRMWTAWCRSAASCARPSTGLDELRSLRADAPPVAVDAPLATLCGGLDESATFAGSPVAIQERLRDEWH